MFSKLKHRIGTPDKTNRPERFDYSTNKLEARPHDVSKFFCASKQKLFSANDDERNTRELLIQSRLGNTEAAPGVTSVASIRSKLSCGGKMKASVSEDSIDENDTAADVHWNEESHGERNGNTFGGDKVFFF